MKKREAQQINACHASFFPAFVEDTEDELKDGEFEVPLKEKVEIPLDEDHKPLEEGDHIWATGLFPEAEQIQYFTVPHRIQPEPVGTTRNHSDSKLDPIFHLDSDWNHLEPLRFQVGSYIP